MCKPNHTCLIYKSHGGSDLQASPTSLDILIRVVLVRQPGAAAALVYN